MVLASSAKQPFRHRQQQQQQGPNGRHPFVFFVCYSIVEGILVVDDRNTPRYSQLAMEERFKEARYNRYYNSRC